MIDVETLGPAWSVRSSPLPVRATARGPGRTTQRRESNAHLHGHSNKRGSRSRPQGGSSHLLMFEYLVPSGRTGKVSYIRTVCILLFAQRTRHRPGSRESSGSDTFKALTLLRYLQVWPASQNIPVPKGYSVHRFRTSCIFLNSTWCVPKAKSPKAKSQGRGKFGHRLLYSTTLENVPISADHWLFMFLTGLLAALT